jgi:hypothetical protein
MMDVRRHNQNKHGNKQQYITGCKLNLQSTCLHDVEPLHSHVNRISGRHPLKVGIATQALNEVVWQKQWLCDVA